MFVIFIYLLSSFFFIFIDLIRIIFFLFSYNKSYIKEKYSYFIRDKNIYHINKLLIDPVFDAWYLMNYCYLLNPNHYLLGLGYTHLGLLYLHAFRIKLCKTQDAITWLRRWTKFEVSKYFKRYHFPFNRANALSIVLLILERTLLVNFLIQ